LALRAGSARANRRAAAREPNARSRTISDEERSHLSFRSFLVFGVILVLVCALGARLYVVQVRDGPRLAAQAGDEQAATYTLYPTRGDIIDRFGTVLAVTLPSYAIGVWPASVRDPRAEALRVAPVLHLTPGQVERVMRTRAPFAYLARDQNGAVARAVAALHLPGIGVTPEPFGRRVEPQGTSGASVIGFTGVDDQGLAGIEYEYNALLAGRAGSVTEETDAQGRPIPFGKRLIHPAQPGQTVVLTIDRSLQFDADQILRRTVERFHARSGSLIVMRAGTGEILALANYPGFDPNHYDAVPPADWRDRAITDPYEPGSTFKLVTATAALDSGKVSLDDAFPALDALRVGGRVIHNADDGLMASGHREETLDDIVTYSHNVGAAEVALRLGKQTMYEYIRRFGFDQPTGVDLPGESAGIVGTPDNWWGSRLATIGFGQGVSVTALALTRAYAAVANGGLLMRPLIVRAITAPDGRVVRVVRPEVVRRVMRPQTAAEVLKILRDVVSRGTAKGLVLAGYPLAGKTGTAQMVIDGQYVPGAYTASFVGILPADRPQYVILVKVDRPQGAYYGAIVAAPAFREMAAKLVWRESLAPSLRAGAAGVQARRTL
jgi:cell division protein FtsI/penicillin-binding protein 2